MPMDSSSEDDGRISPHDEAQVRRPSLSSVLFPRLAPFLWGVPHRVSWWLLLLFGAGGTCREEAKDHGRCRATGKQAYRFFAGLGLFFHATSLEQEPISKPFACLHCRQHLLQPHLVQSSRTHRQASISFFCGLVLVLSCNQFGVRTRIETLCMFALQAASAAAAPRAEQSDAQASKHIVFLRACACSFMQPVWSKNPY